jgi:hypothetical protein
LKQHIVIHLIALSFHKIPRPTDRRHEVIGSHNFGLRRTAGVLSFCLVELTMGNPLPKEDSPPPECLLMLGWTANDASTHHIKMPLPLALRISGSVRVPLRYFIK